jgi:anaerobic selenocysteine-containing dehydrogenase
MIYQLETAISRRKFLKGSGAIALCSVVIPLQSSFTDIVKARKPKQATPAECPICQSIHGNTDCLG